MIIHQMTPNFWYGDAIGNFVREIRTLLRNRGHVSEVYADLVHEKVSAKPYQQFSQKDGEWLIYHFSTGSPVNQFALARAKNLIMIYHNVTPAEFFDDYNIEAARNCRQARIDLPEFRDKCALAIGVSPYNVEELDAIGFKKTAVAPLILNFDKIKPSGNGAFDDDKNNILFVGRVAPNKAIEDLIKIFYFYHNYVEPRSRLILVGGYDANGKYYRSLKNLAATLDLPDVVFAGHVTDEELGKYFASSAAYVCLSKHEGFCVPLLEAMRFNTPVIALGQTGVKHTMGDAGICVDTVAHHEIAELIGLLHEDMDLRKRIIDGQTRRIHDFDRDKMIDVFRTVLESAVGPI